MHEMDSHTLPPLGAADLVIRELAFSEHDPTDEARELAADMHIYRELNQVAVAEVAALTETVKRLRATIISQRGAIRSLRAELARYTSRGATGRAA
ncbi:MAG: hypothetical protein NT151_09530 [Acidobacteria bacterium]|nr:hypothetical protein [Acidobacteriota bacterium]